MIWLVALAVLCTATAQFVQALAARRLNRAAADTSSDQTNRGQWTLMFKEPLVFVAYLLLGVGLVFWLIALTELDVSQTYPLFALAFVATMLFARFGLGEAISPRGWAGAALIVAGGVLCNL